MSSKFVSFWIYTVFQKHVSSFREAIQPINIQKSFKNSCPKTLRHPHVAHFVFLGKIVITLEIILNPSKFCSYHYFSKKLKTIDRRITKRRTNITECKIVVSRSVTMTMEWTKYKIKVYLYSLFIIDCLLFMYSTFGDIETVWKIHLSTIERERERNRQRERKGTEGREDWVRDLMKLLPVSLINSSR